jgi:hypothetical protein
VAFVEAFRRRGIYPLNLDAPSQDTLRTLSVDTLRWQGLDPAKLPPEIRKEIEKQYGGIINGLKKYASACFYLDDRRKLFEVTRNQRITLHNQLKGAFAAVPAFAEELGLDTAEVFEVHELRRAMRVSPDGKHIPQLVVALTQVVDVPANPEDGTPAHKFRGGSTLVVDLSVPEVKYKIIKRINPGDARARRQKRTATFVREAAADPLRALFFAPERPEPFAALHALADEGF